MVRACLIVAAMVCLNAKETEMTARYVNEYCNPMQVQLADPWVLFYENTYYLYGTHDRNAQLGFPVYSSPDLVHWRWRGFAFHKTARTWGQVNFWGPEVHARDGKFYMYYSASPGPDPGPPFNMHLCVAVSSSPLGPFEEVKAPWFQPKGRDEAIDQNVFIDDDGKGYFYWTRVTKGCNQIEVMPLAEDLLHFAGESVLCIRPTQPWECFATHNHLVAEGAFLLKRKGVYYLIYTGNSFTDPHYAVGYATSASPLGPWTKAEHNPVLARTECVAGPGNGMIVPSPDAQELFMVYHAHQSAREVGWRQIGVDRVRFLPSEGEPDKLLVIGPTHAPQPLPSGVYPWPAGSSDRFDGSELDWNRWRIVNEDPNVWRITAGNLEITTSPGDMWRHRADFENLFLQYLPGDQAAVSTRITFEPQADYEQAFLCIWQDHDNYIRLSHAWADGPKFLVGYEENGQYKEDVAPNTLGFDVHLRIVCEGGGYVCQVSGDGEVWETVGDLVKPHFSLAQAGIGAIAPGSGRETVAAFHFMHIER